MICPTCEEVFPIEIMIRIGYDRTRRFGLCPTCDKSWVWTVPWKMVLVVGETDGYRLIGAGATTGIYKIDGSWVSSDVINLYDMTVIERDVIAVLIKIDHSNYGLPGDFPGSDSFEWSWD